MMQALVYVFGMTEDELLYVKLLLHRAYTFEILMCVIQLSFKDVEDIEIILLLLRYLNTFFSTLWSVKKITCLLI